MQHMEQTCIFLFNTVMTVDEYGQGLPVARTICNREDTSALIIFLRAIKDKCGTIAPRWFMSDDLEQYFNAWQGVFGGSDTRKVICVWHVHRV